MDAPVVSAMAGILGSLVGGCATIATTWITQRTLSRRELVRRELRGREKLYGEFISECARLAIDSFASTLERPDKLLGAYALLNRIRLSASDMVLVEGEQMVRRITEQYFSPNLTLEEIHARARNQDVDPLKSFGEACRAELKTMRRRA
jgi:hypothetical protein